MKKIRGAHAAQQVSKYSHAQQQAFVMSGIAFAIGVVLGMGLMILLGLA